MFHSLTQSILTYSLESVTYHFAVHSHCAHPHCAYTSCRAHRSRDRSSTAVEKRRNRHLGASRLLESAAQDILDPEGYGNEACSWPAPNSARATHRNAQRNGHDSSLLPPPLSLMLPPTPPLLPRLSPMLPPLSMLFLVSLLLPRLCTRLYHYACPGLLCCISLFAGCMSAYALLLPASVHQVWELVDGRLSRLTRIRACWLATLTKSLIHSGSWLKTPKQQPSCAQCCKLNWTFDNHHGNAAARHLAVTHAGTETGTPADAVLARGIETATATVGEVARGIAGVDDRHSAIPLIMRTI